MVMEAVPSPQCVGREFVRQYYTLLNQAPLHLHRFYNHDSSFVHGGLKDRVAEEVCGQQQIHQKIMELEFHDCKTKILLVDSHCTLENGVVVQVSGELSNKGQPMRRFVQTFVLALQSAKKYYVRNDIFRYQDDVFFYEEDGADERVSVEAENEAVQPQCAQPTVDTNQTQAPSSNVTVPVTPLTVPTPAVEVAAMVNGAADHSEEENLPRTQPSLPATYTEAPLQQEVPAPVAPAVSPVEAPAAVEVPEEIVELAAEPEAQEVADIPITKQTTEPVTATPAAPPEPKTYANLLKTPSPFNGPTPGLPTTGLPPFSGVRTAPVVPAPQVVSDPAPALATAVNGGSDAAYPPTLPAQMQRNNNFRPPRPAGVGNGRPGPPPAAGSYSRERDSERVDKDRGERAPSRGSTEEIGEWRQQNGDTNREFRRYDDNLQVFVGNIPHFATENDLKELFEQFGKVVDVRIQGKGIRIQNGARAPYYGFVVFETTEATEAALSKKPCLLNGDHRLNVEQKRRGGVMNASGPREQRGGLMNRGGGMGGPGRGGRVGGGPMNMGPPREGGVRGGMTGGSGNRGSYMNRR